MDRDLDPVLFGQLIFERGACLRLRVLARDKDDALIAAFRLRDSANVATGLVAPALFSAEREGPLFAASIRLPDVGEGHNLVGDGKGLSVGFAIATAIWAGLRPQIRTDGSLTELAAKDFEVVG